MSYHRVVELEERILKLTEFVSFLASNTDLHILAEFR